MIVLEAVKQIGHSFDHAAPELKTDHELMLGAGRHNGNSSKHAAAELKRLRVVCVRLNGTSAEAVDKKKLMTSTADEQWYIDDPFDLNHNLARSVDKFDNKSY